MLTPATELKACSGLAAIIGLPSVIYLCGHFPHWDQGAVVFLVFGAAVVLLGLTTLLAGATFILVSWRWASAVSHRDGRWVIRQGPNTRLADTIRFRKTIPLDVIQASAEPSEFVFFVADGRPWVCEKHSFPEG